MTAVPGSINQRPSLIRQTFDELRRKRQIGLMPFIPAGYPDLQTTIACLPALQAGGANVIEIGIPFSDPIADGSIIQQAFNIALSKKLKLGEIFAAIAKAKPTVTIPLVAMVSFSVVYRYGVERFIAEAKLAGFDGLILPDLPPPEAQSICAKVQAGGLDTILLVAPTTSPARQKEIARLSTGFIYYLSVSGITGERDQLPSDLLANVKGLKSVTDQPVCVGFGISKPEHVKGLSDGGNGADGAIVGSAIVKRMTQHISEGKEAIATAVSNYCKELLQHVR